MFRLIDKIIDIIFFSINWKNYFDRSILVISMTVLVYCAGLGFFRKKRISSRTTEETWFLPYFSTFFRKKWKNGIYDKN